MITEAPEAKEERKVKPNRRVPPYKDREYIEAMKKQIIFENNEGLRKLHGNSTWIQLKFCIRFKESGK